MNHTTKVNIKDLSLNIVNGFRLTCEDDLTFFKDADLALLCQSADHIRKSLCSDSVDLCTIVNGKSGNCSEDCKFCAQSASYHTNCKAGDFLDSSKLLAECEKAEKLGINRFSIVTAGRSLQDSDFEKALSAYQMMHQKFPQMILCASHGLLDSEQLKRLKDAGVSMYHTNLETSSEFFPNICTTHSYHDKLVEIQHAKEAGLTVCCGGIIGMGETFEDRLQLALTLSELEITSIPINILIPIPNTPLSSLRPLSQEDILRTVAMFRFINPNAYIRIAAGRNTFPEEGKKLFQSGMNAMLTGDMLTTSGSNIEKDRNMLEDSGFILKEKSKTSTVTSVPRPESKIKQLTAIGLMTAVTCILGPIVLPLPFSPIPISLTNLAIYLTVYILGRNKGALSYLIYVLIGFIGIPVFSGFTGGPGKLLGPTGGYLFGFFLMAFICGSFFEKWEHNKPLCFLGMVTGTISCYLFGTLWLAYQADLNMSAAFMAGVIPFIPGDVIKILVATFIGPKLKQRLKQAGF